MLERGPKTPDSAERVQGRWTRGRLRELTAAGACPKNMLLALLLLSFLAGDTGAWKDFSAWFVKNGTPGAPQTVLAAYTSKLQTDGLPPEQIQARITAVREYMAAHPAEALAVHFNRMFTWPEAPFSREPSKFLIKIASARKPGAALDVGMGEGRNAVWLARAGWTVSGYDISDEGLRQANANAKAAGVTLATALASHEEFDYGQARWDLILMSFAFNNLNDAAYMKRVRESLKPGGVLVIEGFSGPPRGDPNRILKAFLDYRVLYFEDLPDVSDWGRRKMPLMRAALEKAAADQ